MPSRSSSRPFATNAAVDSSTDHGVEAADGRRHREQLGGIQRLERSGDREREVADRRALQRPEMGDAAEGLAQIGGERAHVGAGGALDLGAVHRVRARDIDRLDGEAAHGHRSRRALDLDALARQLVQPASTDLDGADHRRHLFDLADELRGRGRDRRRR